MGIQLSHKTLQIPFAIPKNKKKKVFMYVCTYAYVLLAIRHKAETNNSPKGTAY